MIFVAGLIKFHRLGLQVIGAAHGGNENCLLLGHLLCLLLRQQCNSSVLAFPVFNDGYNPPVLHLAEFPHTAAVDIAVQPVEQIFSFLISQIIAIQGSAVIHQEIIFRPRHKSAAPGNPFTGFSQLPAVKVHFTQNICTIVSVIAVVTYVHAAVPAAGHGINPGASAAFHGNGSLAVAFPVEQPDHTVAGNINTSLSVHCQRVYVRILTHQFRHVTGKDLFALSVKLCQELTGFTVIVIIGIHNCVHRAVFRKLASADTFVAALFRPGDGRRHQVLVRQGIFADVLAAFPGLLIPIIGKIIDIFPQQLHIVIVHILIVYGNKLRHIGPFLRRGGLTAVRVPARRQR